MEVLLVMFIVIPVVVGLVYGLLSMRVLQKNDRTIRRLEPVVTDCRWTRKKFYDEK